MISRRQVMVAALVSVAGISLASRPMLAQASQRFSRTKTVKISQKNFYSTSQTGKTYRFIGSKHKFSFKANHALKNYRHTTWVAERQTKVTKAGKKVTYYWVKNTQNGATGWVASGYLKAGKNFMMTNPKTIKKTNKIMKKAGKVYQLAGNNQHVTFMKGQKLSKTQTYTATKQRTVYKQGKANTYYFVTSPNHQISGWVWSGFVKGGTYQKPSAKINHQSNTNSKSEAFNVSTVERDAIIVLNKYRAQRKVAPVTANAGMQKVAIARGPQMNVEFDHYYQGKNAGTVIAQKLGVYEEYATEDLTAVSPKDTNYATAEDLITGFQGDDHWGDLMNPSFTGVGIALAADVHSPGNYYVAVEFAF